MTRLSVNLNKIATLRNARGENMPNLTEVAKDCERFGAHGITVHPRPDQRHIRYRDVAMLSEILDTEFNVEGYPSEKFLSLVMRCKPTQVTLVPDPPDALTSTQGWDTITHLHLLTDVIKTLKKEGIRTSIFLDTDLKFVEFAAKTGSDRIELHTYNYAKDYAKDKQKAIAPYAACALLAKENGLKINAGHDLNLDNIGFFTQSIPFTEEVSIGHALICESLYLGLENTIGMYLQKIESNTV